ncbi:MAG: alpha/beta hydrolase [Candidatus Pacebacteria bacterium]|nr:alpha/beta hydrolase [Candidatus Paceibacterota bacterium]
MNINYKTIGNGKIPIVLLHGWGMDSEKYVELMKILNIKYSIFNIIVPDLPGFGKSDEPDKRWEVDDYVEFVDKFIEITTRGQKGFELIKNILEKFDPEKAVYTEKKSKPILIGHSFGGMIAIKYAVKYPEKIDKLILTGAVGIKHKLTAKQKAFSILGKTGKSIFSLPIINNFQKPVYKIFSKIAQYRKKDYYSANSRMKEIMKNVLAEDLMDCLDKIKTPTLLVWGREDKTTPLADGEIMNEKIKNSELKVIDDANHSLSCQKAEEFARTVEEFIKK